jgi:quercetin dioxygenase-like cupin family protein
MKNIVHRKDVEEFQVTKVEGLPLPGEVRARKMLYGNYGLLIEVFVSKGIRTPLHTHAHDSFLYIIKGRVKVKVGNEENIVEAGDAVLHPAGVEHISEALEDSVWIEVKAPPEETW